MATKRELIGWDIEDAALSANNTVNSTPNILGMTSVITTKGTPTMDFDPIKLNSLHHFSKFVHLASVLGLETDKVKRTFTSIFNGIKYGESAAAAKPLAFTETADVDVSSFAGGNEALQSSVTLHWHNDRVYHTATVTGTGETRTVVMEPIANFAMDFSKFYFDDGISTRAMYMLFFDYEENEFN